MERIRQQVDRMLERIIIGLMGLSVLNVLWQVTTRSILRDPSSYTEELARFLLIWLSLLGAAYAVSKKVHLSIDLFTARWEGKKRLYSEIFIEASIFLFALLVMIFGGLRLVSITLALQQISAALQIQLGYVYLVVPLSGLLITFYSAAFIVEHVKALREE
ncbi:MAG: TRAP transporter small permease [Acidobacteriota bacterium]